MAAELIANTVAKHPAKPTKREVLASPTSIIEPTTTTSEHQSLEPKQLRFAPDALPNVLATPSPTIGVHAIVISGSKKGEWAKSLLLEHDPPLASLHEAQPAADTHKLAQPGVNAPAIGDDALKIDDGAPTTDDGAIKIDDNAREIDDAALTQLRADVHTLATL